MEFTNQHSFYCKHCNKSRAWDQIYFGPSGHPRCKKCAYQVAVDKPKPNQILTRKHAGKLRVCLKPYPICDAQLMMTRNYKPVIFCANSGHCLKVQLIPTPKNCSESKIT